MKQFWVFGLISSLLLVLGGGHGFAEDRKVGILNVQEGTILVLRGDQTLRMDEGNQQELLAKDTIQTLNSSFGRVTLGQGEEADLFSLGPNTTFLIEEYLVTEEEPTRGVFQLLSGKVRSVISRFQKKKDIKVRTATATIGVKGTDFLTEVPTDDITQVTTFEGLVAMENKIGDILKTVEIGAGTSSIVVAGATPFNPLSLSRESLLESASQVASSSTTQVSQLASERSTARESISSFRRDQFNELLEQAAQVKGSILKIQIEFPEGI